MSARYSTLASVAAIVAALGGVALGAGTIDGDAVEDRSLTGADVARGSLTGVHFANRSIGLADVAPSTRVTLSGQTVVAMSQGPPVTDSTTSTLIATCPGFGGYQAISWGFGFTPIPGPVTIKGTFAPDLPNTASGWVIDLAQPAPAQWTASVACLDVSP